MKNKLLKKIKIPLILMAISVIGFFIHPLLMHVINYMFPPDCSGKISVPCDIDNFIALLIGLIVIFIFSIVSIIVIAIFHGINKQL